MQILMLTLRYTREMSDDYPFTWAPLSEADDATVKRCFGELGKCRQLVRFLPELIFLFVAVLP